MVNMDLEEKIYLKSLTGMVIGGMALKNYHRVAFVSPKSMVCTSMCAAAEASFMLATHGNAAHFIAEAGMIEEMVNRIVDFDPEMTVLVFGGEEMETAEKLFLETLRELAAGDADADLLIHFKMLESGALNEAIKDREIREYLQDIEAFVFTMDLDRGEMLLNLLDTEEGKLLVDRIEVYKLTFEHTELLRKAMEEAAENKKEV